MMTIPGIVIIALFVEMFFVTSTVDLLVKACIAVLVIFSSFFLYGSIKREIKSEKKIRKLLDNLDTTHEQLHTLDRKKSEFVAIASHHLRDPLTAISGYASLLMDGSYGDMPDGVKGALSKILDSSKRLITMISDFMDITRIERGEMKYTFAEVDMKALVYNLAAEMKPSVIRAHLQIDIFIENESTEHYITVADSGKLRQVLSNLIDNAIKYTPKGGLSVLLHKSADKKHIVFSVSDTGIGMSHDTLQKIFKKFSRAEGVSRVYTDGSGLGLYIATKIIRKHEGKIRATSKGQHLGSTFSVELGAKQ
jgi:signal transduction histidine kinase